jgi:hypothetical protein
MQEFVILTKMEELDAYSHNALIQFPKYEKFVLCAAVRQCLADIIKLVVRAGKRYHKKTTLQDLDIEIEYLRALIRKAHRLNYINMHRYHVWVGHVDEVGKMTGAWIKNKRITG